MAASGSTSTSAFSVARSVVRGRVLVLERRDPSVSLSDSSDESWDAERGRSDNIVCGPSPLGIAAKFPRE